MNHTFAFITGTHLLWAGLLFGALFGFLLHRGGVTDYNVIVRQFLFRDFTVLKVMLTAIVVGGVGVWLLHGQELANFHIKPAAMLAVTAGAVLFGIGMVVYGYCPGTGVAAIATGRLDALVGFVGMLAGGALYALSYDWVAANILPVGDLGKNVCRISPACRNGFGMPGSWSWPPPSLRSSPPSRENGARRNPDTRLDV